MRVIALLLAAALTGCGDDDPDRGPGGVSAQEARELNEAAEMLDTNSVAIDTIVPANAPANER